ncbi:MBOAT family protein [Clostridium sp. SHJSY1]|uniref:MBOAT family O-acyltransferase n=1 Tax=Clostridium sp. SHJSY1 TaxID=2942483 RepID=UPI00287711B3|nr:MBOAT family protein [Clostridium sp. SHJSY1]MDS0525431.1 MBOAT family protein [Clostridium sp. SHJSY1]
MLFASNTFLFYFLPIVLLGYYLFKFSRGLQNMWLFLVSVIFYAWGEPVFVLILLASILLNTFFGIIISKLRSNLKASKIALAIICAINISLLAVFKYTGFIITNINSVVGREIFEEVKIALPIGISFFTFHALSYVIDVYRGTVDAEKNPLNVGLYIFFFPQLVAGPVLQYHGIQDQIKNRKSSWAKFSKGCARFTFGLGKKLLFANSFAIVADRIFDLSAIGTELYNVPVMLAWIGSIAYTLQIYYDFSGYSDMAIGLGLMFGFEIDENFDYPYVSSSVTEFWRRWHISMTNWFREYVYFPLGGSRVSNADKMVRNMFIVWLLTGIWHGAAWTFIVWGMWNFLFLLLERFTNLHRKDGKSVFRHIYTLLVVNFGWVLFRSTNLHNAGKYFLNMFGLNNNGFYSDLAITFLREYGVFFVVGIIFCLQISRGLAKFMEENKQSIVSKVYGMTYPFILTSLLVVCILYLARGSYSTFIYFNF